MSTTKQDVECPYCGAHFSVDRDWLEENKRTFCGTCCKAFDVEAEKEDTDDFYGDFYD
jgi:endogenous inhibitor of DNA gyrase (YacG/DUF329 family)